MSLFSGEQPVLGVFSTSGVPTIAVPQVAPATGLGAGIDLVVPITTLNLTNAVTTTNQTSATALMTYKFPAGSLNQLNRIVDIFAAGEITTQGTATTTTFAVTANDGTNTRTIASWTTGALTISQSNLPWEIDLTFYVNKAGSTGNLYGHGQFSMPLTAPTAALSAYADNNTAATSALDTTQLITLSVTQLFGTSVASQTATQDLMQIVFAN